MMKLTSTPEKVQYPLLATSTTHTLLVIAVVNPIAGNVWRVQRAEVVIRRISDIIMPAAAAWLGAVIIIGIDDAIIVITITSSSTAPPSPSNDTTTSQPTLLELQGRFANAPCTHAPLPHILPPY
jgi:hypothetical protein